MGKYYYLKKNINASRKVGPTYGSETNLCADNSDEIMGGLSSDTYVSSNSTTPHSATKNVWSRSQNPQQHFPTLLPTEPDKHVRAGLEGARIKTTPALFSPPASPLCLLQIKLVTCVSRLSPSSLPSYCVLISPDNCPLIPGAPPKATCSKFLTRLSQNIAPRLCMRKGGSVRPVLLSQVSVFHSSQHVTHLFFQFLSTIRDVEHLPAPLVTY